MKTSLLIGLLLLPLPALAANADQPYGNVDRSNDAGNGTGDKQVDQLNRGQLNENQPPNAAGTPAPAPQGAPAPASPPAPSR